MRIITLQRSAVCVGCGVTIPAGTKARYYSADKIYCETHSEAAPSATSPAAGSSPGPEAELFPPEPAVQEDMLLICLEELQKVLGDLVVRVRRENNRSRR